MRDYSLVKNAVLLHSNPSNLAFILLSWSKILIVGVKRIGLMGINYLILKPKSRFTNYSIFQRKFNVEHYSFKLRLFFFSICNAQLSGFHTWGWYQLHSVFQMGKILLRYEFLLFPYSSDMMATEWNEYKNITDTLMLIMKDSSWMQYYKFISDLLLVPWFAARSRVGTWWLMIRPVFGVGC